MRYKGLLSKAMLALLVLSFFVLGYLGTLKPTDLSTGISQICTLIYFAYFVLMPWYTRIEKTKTPPERLT